MRSWMLVAAAATLPACLTIPAFTPPDAGDDTLGVSLTQEADNSYTANGPAFSIHFPVTGFHYPDQITLGPVEALATDPNPGCESEVLTGIGLAPSTRVDGTSVVPSAMATIDVIADGPAIVKLDLTWTSALACSAMTKMTGQSTFTMTPDGRVVRFDAIHPPMAAADVATCACEAGAMSNWDLRSDLVATTSQFNRVVDRSLTDITPSDAAPQDQILCTSGPDHSIGFGFERNHVRVHAVTGGNAFTYDFLNSPTPTLDATTVINAATSAYLFGDGTGCTASVAKLLAFGGDPQLVVDGVSISTATDGIYGGDDGSGHVGIATGATTTLTAATAPIPAGFVVWLDLGVTRSSFAITNPAETGTSWYRTGNPKQSAASQLIVWFRDALPIGQTITIVAGND